VSNDVSPAQAVRLEPLRFPLPRNSRPLIAAHRGALNLAAENTIAAFELALDHGADMIELDVHPTRDGTFVVLHDVSVDRTTDGRGLLAGLTAAEVGRFDAGSWFEGGQPARVPTLEDVLEWAQERAYLVIDVRNYAFLPFYDTERTADAVIGALRNGDVVQQVIVQCLDHELALAVRARCDEVVVGVTQHGRPPAPATIAQSAGASFMSIDAPFTTSAFVSSLHVAGIGVMASVELRLPGVRDEPEAVRETTQRLIDLGVDVLVTDDVAATATAVSEHCGQGRERRDA
jgi:glycerophosphoryl diester phosphodiesterase